MGRLPHRAVDLVLGVLRDAGTWIVLGSPVAKGGWGEHPERARIRLVIIGRDGIRHLKEKIDAGVNFSVLQFFSYFFPMMRMYSLPV